MSSLEKLKAINLANPGNTGTVRVIAYGEIVPERWGMNMKPAYRITRCCGVAMKGKPTYQHIWDRVNGKAVWDEDRLITIGFAGKTVKPNLGDGRTYIRLDSGKKDFIITWRDY